MDKTFGTCGRAPTRAATKRKAADCGLCCPVFKVLPPYWDRERVILPPLAVPPSPGQSPLTFPGRAGRGRALSSALDISGFRPEPGMALWLAIPTMRIR